MHVCNFCYVQHYMTRPHFLPTQQRPSTRPNYIRSPPCKRRPKLIRTKERQRAEGHRHRFLQTYRAGQGRAGEDEGSEETSLDAVRLAGADTHAGECILWKENVKTFFISWCNVLGWMVCVYERDGTTKMSLLGIYIIYIFVFWNRCQTYQCSNRQSGSDRGHRARLYETDCAACGGESAEDEGCLVEGLGRKTIRMNFERRKSSCTGDWKYRCGSSICWMVGQVARWIRLMTLTYHDDDDEVRIYEWRFYFQTILIVFVV